MDEHPPLVAWKRCFDEPFPEGGTGRSISPKLLLEMLPVILRMGAEERRDRANGREPVFTMNNRSDAGPVQGVPLGG